MDYFPFEQKRLGQEQFIKDIQNASTSCRSIIAHAPTGIGKTAGVLSAVLPSGNTILYLVPKQSQHRIVIETLQAISERTGTQLPTVDIISKQAMCLQDSMKDLFYADFLRQCFNLRKVKACEFWGNQKHFITDYGVIGVEDLIQHGMNNNVCPYYTSIERLQSARVVIADYNLIFSDMLQKTLNNLGKNLRDLIIIVDEAHNLPDRVIDHLSGRLTIHKLDSAAMEIRKENYECFQLLKSLKTTLKSYLDKVSSDMKTDTKKEVDREEFENLVIEVLHERFDTKPYTTFIDELGDHLYNNYSCEVAKFLDGWANQKECVHMVVKTEKGMYITYKCLDPSIMTVPIFKECRNVVAMSGTLYPMEMYRDVLGFPDDTILKKYDSPYPKTNKLNIITSGITTEYAQRTDLMYMKIAKTISDISVGNTLVFFPSYSMLNMIKERLPTSTINRVIVEKQDMTKQDKQNMYEFLVDFGAIIFGVQGGSLSEGLDYKNNIVKTIIVVGLPLAPPDVDMKAQIGFYTRKFGKDLGRRYAYVYPSMRKAIQAGGRGVRSEADKCIVVYMDYRYGYSIYRECFEDDIDSYSVEETLLLLKKFRDVEV